MVCYTNHCRARRGLRTKGSLKELGDRNVNGTRPFGLRIGAVTKRSFEDRVLELVADDPSLMAIVEPLLRARRAIIEAFKRLDRLCIQLARRYPICQ